MGSQFNGTIAAISTPLAPGGLGVVRISGDEALPVAAKVFTAKGGKDAFLQMQGYRAVYGKCCDQDGLIDEGVALVFRSPHSYTGEDVVEISVHGGVYILKRLLGALVDAGARPADPGEFTKRAYLSGKMDLTKAEGVISLIQAAGKESHRAALAAMDGRLSRSIREIKDRLLHLTGGLAAWIDYPEEDIPPVDTEGLVRELHTCRDSLSHLLAGYENGKIVREGIDTVICGRPNVGKSTLMNLLSGADRSIVTDIAGTTRDIVENSVTLDGIPLHLSDTAGLRDTLDEIERIGVQNARKRIETAMLIIPVFDASLPLTEEDRKLLDQIAHRPVIAVINKTDLPAQIDQGYIEAHAGRTVLMSAATGEGLDALTGQIRALFHMEAFDFQRGVLFSQRQRDSIQRAFDLVVEAAEAVQSGVTLDAVSVVTTEAIDALMELTGENASAQVVDDLFSRFCVGK